MQKQFARAILDLQASGTVTAAGGSARFNVYRNNFAITLRNALRTTFPAVERLVGEEFFSALAFVFAESHPPRSPIMSSFGLTFSSFLENIEALSDFPYLADVARIEFARVQAYHAADADCFGINGEATLITAIDCPVRLHPSVCVIPSRHPAYSIWQAQFAGDDLAQPEWTAESSIVWRHAAHETVEVMRLDVTEQAMLASLVRGRCLAALLAACPDQGAAAGLVGKFIELTAAGIVVPALDPQPDGEHQ